MVELILVVVGGVELIIMGIIRVERVERVSLLCVSLPFRLIQTQRLKELDLKNSRRANY